MNTKGIFSKATDHWKTPSLIYDIFMLKDFFDPCPYMSTFDGLTIDWKKYNFVNPPYSQIKLWIDKALLECEKGNYTIMLVPARTDTKWFHKIYHQQQVSFTFLKGRLKFNDGKNGAPFPSMYIEFIPNNWEEK